MKKKIVIFQSTLHGLPNLIFGIFFGLSLIQNLDSVQRSDGTLKKRKKNEKESLKLISWLKKLLERMHAIDRIPNTEM
jgi:hypothetical protein